MILLLACTSNHPDSVDSEPPDSDPAPCGQEQCEDGLCWWDFCEDSFLMGSEEGVGEEYEWPAHTVHLKRFDLMSTEVPVWAYQDCVAAGACSEWPESEDAPSSCNQWDPEGTAEHAQNCVDWFMATDFCAWVGGRLPTEAEWEYAARSGGQEDKIYPWGQEEPSCELANFKDDEGLCGKRTEAVCSHPAGNTEQGLCDMGGNVYEWVEDWFHNTYEGAPTDGSAWNEPASTFKTMRGSGVSSAEDLRTRNRTFHEPDFSYGGMGFRCAR